MLIYLDTNRVIYLIELPAGFGQRATSRIATIRANRDQMMVSDLTRVECRVKRIATGQAILLAEYDTFFTSTDVQVVSLTGAVCDRATLIRAQYRYKLADSLNLAAAVENHCDVFLTNDARLSQFPDITVEVLP
jgi:predicted nucleic acid-binding protein